MQSDRSSLERSIREMYIAYLKSEEFSQFSSGWVEHRSSGPVGPMVG
jgi:hypothetical protein